jgi:hypothetical protein
MEYHEAIKRMKSCHCKSIDAIAHRYIKWNISGIEREVLHDLTRVKKSIWVALIEVESGMVITKGGKESGEGSIGTRL